MVVDDDQQMGRLIRTLFELEGHQVVVTPSYPEILPALQQTQPDLLLMDVRIQQEETIPLIRQIRAHESLADTPVVMTSGLDCGKECMAAGADLFILKPFLPDELVQIVNDLLGKD